MQTKVIPNLATASKTDPDFPPHCPRVSPPTRQPGGMFYSTITLEWELDENNITRVKLPDCFTDADRTKMLRAFEGARGPARVIDDPMTEITASLHVGVGAERLPILGGSVCVVKRTELAVSKGSARVRVLLLVEYGRDRAAEILDVLEADVHVTVEQQLGLWQPKAKAEESDLDENGDAGKDHDLPPEPEAPTTRRKPRQEAPATP